jgi:hypothetical protein
MEMIIDFDVDDETVLEPRPARRCCDCCYWSGNPGNMSADFVCAVNIPHPSPAELDRVDYRKAYAYHNCLDFVTNNEQPRF